MQAQKLLVHCRISFRLSGPVGQGSRARVFSIARAKLGYTFMKIKQGCSPTFA